MCSDLMMKLLYFLLADLFLFSAIINVKVLLNLTVQTSEIIILSIFYFEEISSLTRIEVFPLFRCLNLTESAAVAKGKKESNFQLRLVKIEFIVQEE